MTPYRLRNALEVRPPVTRRVAHRRLGVAATGAFVAVAAVAAAATAACARPAPPKQPSPAPKWVYLLPAQFSPQPADPDEWRAAGVTLVDSFDALRDRVGGETEAILVDAAALPQIDKAWLQAQARPPRARVIVGVNLDLRALQELLDLPQPWSAPWNSGEPQFAMAAAGRGCASAGQSEFSMFSPLSTFLRAWVEHYSVCTRTT